MLLAKKCKLSLDQHDKRSRKGHLLCDYEGNNSHLIAAFTEDIDISSCLDRDNTEKEMFWRDDISLRRGAELRGYIPKP